VYCVAKIVEMMVSRSVKRDELYKSYKRSLDLTTQCQCGAYELGIQPTHHATHLHMFSTDHSQIGLHCIMWLS